MKRRCANYYLQNRISGRKSGRRGISFSTAFGIGFVMVISLIIVFSSFADAHNDQQKYYKSVCVQSGQTLWDISGVYCTAEYKDRNAYIDEVMQLNHLTSSEIHSGNYLIIPYYSTEPL